VDILALQHLREGGLQYPVNSFEVVRVDNHQAWIESRLQQLQTRTREPLVLCSIPAAFLCAYGLFAEVWAATLIPSCLSTQLLRLLQTYERWDGWDSHSDLLLWLISTGEAFATDACVRAGFVKLRQGCYKTRLQQIGHSPDVIERHLRKFIFLKHIHGKRCGRA